MVHCYQSVEEFAAAKGLFAAVKPAAHGVDSLRAVSVAGLVGKSHAVVVPGSKSFTNRAIVLAGLAKRPVTLKGVLLSDDSFWGFHSLLGLGFVLEFDFANREVLISPPVLKGNTGATIVQNQGQIRPTELFFGMAGTLARFFPAVLLCGKFSDKQSFLLSGEKRLCERPLKELTAALRELGARISGDSLPLQVWPSQLEGSCTISGAKSGQFLSGLVIAAAAAQKPVTIHRVDNLVQPDYVRMTIDALNAFGARISADTELNWVRTEPVPELYPVQTGGLAQGAGLAESAGCYLIEADASTACYFLTMAVLFDLDLTVTNIGFSTRQPDIQFVRFLERVGARFEINETAVRHLPHQTLRASGNSHVIGKQLKGGFAMNFNAFSDQALTAGLVALFADASITITGVAHIRKHESDRVACFCANLAELGVKVIERPDGFEVFPLVTSCGGAFSSGSSLRGLWKTHNDHRFAMVGALLSMREPEVVVENPACCEKTAPSFFADLLRMGVEFSES